MIKVLQYYINIQDIDGNPCEIYSDYDFQRVVDMFTNLAFLDLPVSLSYCYWFTDEKDKD